MLDLPLATEQCPKRALIRAALIALQSIDKDCAPHGSIKSIILKTNLPILGNHLGVKVWEWELDGYLDDANGIGPDVRVAHDLLLELEDRGVHVQILHENARGHVAEVTLDKTSTPAGRVHGMWDAVTINIGKPHEGGKKIVVN